MSAEPKPTSPTAEIRKAIAILARAGANYVRLVVRGPGFPGGINTTWADETYHAGTKDPQ